MRVFSIFKTWLPSATCRNLRGVGSEAPLPGAPAPLQGAPGLQTNVLMTIQGILEKKMETTLKEYILGSYRDLLGSIGFAPGVISAAWSCEV